jgi:Tol biopolymer transport system component
MRERVKSRNVYVKEKVVQLPLSGVKGTFIAAAADVNRSVEKSLPRAVLMMLLCCFSILHLSVDRTAAQGFGKNKVQYRQFSWSHIVTSHFDIYYYPGAERVVEYAIDISEETYRKVSRDLNHTLHRRIPIIIYRSRNDFAQTNVIMELIEEGVGGFTETFKNRVVVPFNGSYQDFDHVLAHELAHAISFDLLSGGAMESLILSQVLSKIPLWILEGLSEYESLGWNGEGEMFMKDAVLNEYIMDIEELNMVGGGYIAYKEGQSIMKYIAEHMGREKFGELLKKIRFSPNIENTMEEVFGMELKDFNSQYQMEMKRQYWPEIVRRRKPSEEARQMTDHNETKSYINVRPTITPGGQNIAMLTDQESFASIYLISALDGKVLHELVQGERSGGLEEMHLFKSRMSWDPTGNMLSFTAKAGAYDVLYIYDLKDMGIVRSINPKLDGISSPSWSPDGKQIVFTGLKNSKNDLYLLDLATEEISQLIDDFYNDEEPCWSSDGRGIYFSSDRGLHVPTRGLHLEKYDIYYLDLDTDSLSRITDLPGKESSPATWSDATRLLFASDHDGVTNICMKDLETDEYFQITNVLTGAFSPSCSRDGDRLAFSSFFDGGWDIFLMKNPFERMMPIEESLPSVEGGPMKEIELSITDDVVIERGVSTIRKKESAPHGDPDYTIRESVFPDHIDKQEDDLDKYRIKKYRLKFSPDWVSAGFQYSSITGFGGGTSIALSDILGNHRIYVYTDLLHSIQNSYFQVLYYYLPKRVDMGVGIFHVPNYYLIYDQYGNTEIIVERYYGANGILSYPLDKFHRIEFHCAGYNIHRDRWVSSDYGWEELNDSEDIFIVIPGISFIRDTTLWGVVGPVDGSRMNFTLEKTVDYRGSKLNFTNGFVDIRKYFRILKDYSFATRFLGAASVGPDPQMFYIGGESSIRGYDTASIRGNKAGFVNVEFRYPFIRQLFFRWPLPLRFQDIRGAVFADVGGATDRLDWFRGIEDGQLKDLKGSYGVGMRIRISYLVLHFDYAWPTDLKNSGKPRLHFSFLGEF